MMKVAFSEHTFDNGLFREHFGEDIAEHEESIRAGYALAIIASRCNRAQLWRHIFARPYVAYCCRAAFEAACVSGNQLHAAD